MSSDDENNAASQEVTHVSGAQAAIRPPTSGLQKLQPGDLLDSKYRIISELGHGGMGTVYRAEQIHLSREVAIKMLRVQIESANDNVEFLRRFSVEAKTLAKIKHPNAVSVHDFGFSGGYPFLVMELVDGISLRKLLVKDGPMPLLRVIRLMNEVCQAVHCAHLQGVVHRDLKPDNIVVSRLADGSEHAVVLDFGIAKIRDAEQSLSGPITEAGILVGTPQYMSPEQFRGMEVDARSDVYAIGVILYELFSGALPFISDSAISLAMKHISEPPPPFQAAIGEDAEEIVRSCLAKDPAERPQSAAEVGERLRAVLDETSVHPIDPGVTFSVDAPRRRSSIIFNAAIALSVCVLVAALATPRILPPKPLVSPKVPVSPKVVPGPLPPVPLAPPAPPKMHPEEIERLVSAAGNSVSAGEYLKAKELLTRVVAEDPKNAPAFALLGRCSAELGDNQNAIHGYQNAVELGLGGAELHDALGIAFQNIGNHGSAISSFSRALKADPKYLPAYYHLAESYEKSKNWEKAILSYRVLLKLEPNKTPIHQALSNVLTQAGRPKEAHQEMIKALTGAYPALAKYSHLANDPNILGKMPTVPVDPYDE